MNKNLEEFCNIGNVKLYVIFERRYGKMWQELNRLITKDWGKETLDRKDHIVAEKWHGYLKDMGLETQEEKPTGEHVMDPCSKMGQSRYWPRYIAIPEELSIKILTLGYLP